MDARSAACGGRVRSQLFASLLLAGLMLVGARPALAHQPVLVGSATTEVVEPEISKAYYGVLSGAAHAYVIDSDIEFDLYVGILVPDGASPERDVMAEIYRGEELMERIGGAGAAWVSFYEPFGQNTYWDGGEYRLRAAPGVYTIRVSSPDNAGKYSLAIGEIEYFDLEDRANALAVLPGIQREFFGVSAVELVGTRYGLLNLLVIYGAALLAALLYGLVLRRRPVRPIAWIPRPIGTRIRVAAAVALFGLAVTTSWSPLLLFVSGFLLFDALLGRLRTDEPTGSEAAPPRDA
jgi:hypothetical protein